jgi:hypothetical protein
MALSVRKEAIIVSLTMGPGAGVSDGDGGSETFRAPAIAGADSDLIIGASPGRVPNFPDRSSEFPGQESRKCSTVRSPRLIIGPK